MKNCKCGRKLELQPIGHLNLSKDLIINSQTCGHWGLSPSKCLQESSLLKSRMKKIFMMKS